MIAVWFDVSQCAVVNVKSLPVQDCITLLFEHKKYGSKTLQFYLV